MTVFTVYQGRILRDGDTFLPLGVNYHPPVGCRIWTDWRPADLREDFHDIAAAGLNTVRLFLFWRDAQPRPDQVSQAVLDRLVEAVTMAQQAGLVCVISLFTIWMNGQLLDLPWRQGRNIWRDHALLRAEAFLVRRVAEALRDHDAVLAYDLGDELWDIDPRTSGRLTRAEVADWQGRLAGEIRKAAPAALVMQANNTSGVFDAAPFGCDNSAQLDLLGVHGFPSWAPGSIESTMSFKATHLVPFLARAARAYGTPLVDEVGSYGTDENTAAAYLRATTASALGNGAAGMLVWCWQDIASLDEPYAERPMERFAGLRRLNGTPKPALRAFRQALAVIAAGHEPAAHVQTALYLPQRVRSSGASYLDAPGSMVASFYAYLLLKRAHVDVEVVADELVGRSLVICPSPTRLTATDIDRLARSAHAGATVYLSLGEHLHGFAGGDLVGAEIVDFDHTDAGKGALCWDAEDWPIDWAAARCAPTTMRAVDAQVLARYPDASAALVCRPMGRGRVVFTNAPFEAQLDAHGRLVSHDWPGFYRRLTALARVSPVAHCSDPDVELIPREAERVLAVNHGARPAAVELRRGAVSRALQVPAKDWAVVDFTSREDGG